MGDPIHNEAVTQGDYMAMSPHAGYDDGRNQRVINAKVKDVINKTNDHEMTIEER